MLKITLCTFFRIIRPFHIKSNDLSYKCIINNGIISGTFRETCMFKLYSETMVAACIIHNFSNNQM